MKIKSCYVTCPTCGKLLCRAISAEALQLICPKCHGEFILAVKDGSVSITEAPSNTSSQVKSVSHTINTG